MARFEELDRSRKEFSERKILVSGGAGFLGSAVVKELLALGAEVTVLDNFSSGKIEYLRAIPHAEELTIIQGDICDNSIVEKAIRHIQIIIHLAALPFVPDSYYHPRDFFRVNVDGTLNLLLGAGNSESFERFVYISSSEVYGSAKFEPMDESHPTLPHSSYAASKLAADRVTFTTSKELGMPSVIVRPFNSFGPNITQPYIVPEIILQAMNGNREIELGNIEAYRDLTYVDDTAHGIVLSAAKASAVGEVINIGSGTAIGIRELALKIASLMGKNISINSDKSRCRPYDVEKLVCDNSKSKRLLDWEPRVTLDSGLQRTIEWARNHPIHFGGPFRTWYRTNKITPLLESQLTRLP